MRTLSPALELIQPPEDAPVASVTPDDSGVATLTESGRTGDVPGTRDRLARTDSLHNGLVDTERGMANTPTGWPTTGGWVGRFTLSKALSSTARSRY